MKKIFAFVLATIMVLSLVPASAFAAISVDTPCPTTHTVANCDAVIVSTKDADCENAGYTIFKCTKCGEQFLGNIVAAGEHEWVLDEDHEDTKIPSCTEGKPGQGHFECSVCGEEADLEIPANELHDLAYVSGVGCEATYICTVCEGTFNSKGGAVGEHEGWELTEIITEPTAKDEGSALFTCTADKCGATKEVTIDTQCVCGDLNNPAKLYNAYAVGQFVLKTKPSKVTCTSAGKYAIYACKDCGQFFRWKTTDKTASTELPEPVVNDDGIVTGIKNGEFERVSKNNKDTYNIGELGHSYVADNDADHPLLKVDACNYSKWCKRCEKYIAQDGHTWYNVSSTKETCETYGITYKVCQVCGSNKNDIVEPLGHDLATYTYESTCGTYGYTITYCKNNAKCTYAKPTSGANYYYAATGKLYADVTVDHDNKSSTAKEVRPIVSIVDLTTLKGTHTFTNTQIIGGASSSCAGNLIVMQQCKDCNYITYKQIAGTGHKYGEATTIPATCQSSGSIMKTCTVCNYTDIIVLPKLTAHVYEVTNLIYNCAPTTENPGYVGTDGRYYHGIQTLGCKYGCVGTEAQQYIDAVGASATKAWFENIDEAKAYHGDNLVLSTHRNATCSSAGYGVYTCSKCAKSVYVTYPATSHVPTIDATGHPITIPGTPATCVTSGTKSYNVCSVCQSYITLNEKNEYVTLTAAELITNPHSATLAPVVVYSCDGASYVTYYQCTVEGCGKYFADADAKTPVERLPADKAHSWKTIDAGVVLNCNNNGYPEVRYCATCKTLEKTQYAEFLVDGKVVVDVYGDVETWTVEEYAIPTVINYVNGVYSKSAYKVAKYSHGEAKNCPAEWAGLIMDHEAYENAANCDDEYGYVGHLCLICGYEYITNFVTAAGGHYNIAGEKLEESCANYVAVKDRVCVNCDQAIGTDSDLHNVVMGETVAPTCSTEGYTFNYCKNDGCTWVEIINPTPAIKPATYHKNTANLVVGGTPADYATVGNSYLYCPVCLEVIKVEKETKVSEAGLEIYVSTDAESYIPGASVYVTVTLDSLKGVKVWGLNFPVNYDPEVFEFVGYEFNTANSAFQTFAANDVAGGYTAFALPGGDPSELYTDGKYVAAGVVSIVANADDEVEIKGAETLVVLEFKVISYSATSDVTFSVADKNIITGGKIGEKHEYYPYWKFEGTSTSISFTADVVNGTGKAVPVNYLGSNSVTVDVTGFLDLDGKAGLTMADAHALYALIYNNEYDVEADADFDGKVTAKDLSILYNILIGATTVEEIVTPAASDEMPEDWNAGAGAR